MSTSKNPAGTQPQTAWGDTARISSVPHLSPNPEGLPRHTNVPLSKETFKSLLKGFFLAVAPWGIASLVPEVQQDLQVPPIEPSQIPKEKLPETQHETPTGSYLCHIGDEEGQPGYEEHAQEDAQGQAGLQSLLAVLVGEPPALAAGQGLAWGTWDLRPETGSGGQLSPAPALASAQEKWHLVLQILQKPCQ